MRRWKLVLISLGLVAVVGVLSLWQVSRTELFWRWGGRKLVALVQERLQGDLKVGKVSGNPLTGLFFQDLSLREPQGEVLRAEKLELRFSFWSFLKLQPSLAYVGLQRPRLHLSRDQQGRWNLARLLKPGSPGAALPITSLQLSRIIIKGGEITLSWPEGGQSFSEVDFQGALDVSQPGCPQQIIALPHADLTFNLPQGRYRLHGSFIHTRECLDLPSLTLYSRERQLLNLAGKVRLGQDEPLVDSSLDLLGSGGELHRLWPRWPETWKVAGKFRIRGPVSQLQVVGNGSWQEAGYNVTGSLGHRNGGWQYDLDLQIRGVHGQTLASLPSFWAEKARDLSPLDARVRLKGAGLSWPPPRLEWSLECSPFAYRDVQVEELRLSLAGDSQGQRFNSRARGSFGRMEVTASGPLLTTAAGGINIQAEDLQLHRLGVSSWADSSISGGFAGTFSLPGVRAAGELEARGQLLRQPLKELKGRVNWDGTKLEVTQARLLLGSLAADLKGSLENKGLEVQYRGQVTADGSWPWIPSDWRGRLDGEGAVKGPWSGPQVTFQGRGQGLWGEGFGVESLGIRAEAAGWLPQEGRLELQGSGLKTPVANFSQGRLNCQGEAGRWRFSFDASSPLGKAEVEGQADLKATPVNLLINRYRFQYLAFSSANTTPVQLRLFEGWELAPATFRVNDGHLTLQAVARTGHLTGRVEFTNLPAELLAVKGTPCEGRLGGQLNLSGDPAHPIIQGRLTWGPGRWGNFSFKSFSTTVNYRDARLFLSGGLEESASGPGLSWEGYIPLNLTLLPLKWSLGDRDLNFRVQGENANLTLLTGLTPEIPRAEGPLEVSAAWQGNPRHPVVSGYLRWGEGSITFRQAGTPYKVMPGQARLQGEKLLVPEITLLSGNGAARLTGEITLAGFLPEKVDARGVLKDFVAVKRTGSEAAGSGNLTLTGPWASPLLKGRLDIIRASFIPGFFRTSEKHEDVILVRPPEPPPPPKNAVPQAPRFTFYHNLRMDLDLEGAGNLWVKDRRLVAEMAGKVKTLKETGGPAYFKGEVQVLRGTYELQGRIFKIQQGIIRLPGRPKADVTLEGKALHEIGNLTLVLTASGIISKPQVRLESIPPLPPEDLLAYLLFGRPAGRLTREESLSAGQQAAGVLGGLTAKKLQELLGKDFPLVGDVHLRSSQAEAGRQAVGVTKPLTKDLSVSFERKFDPLYRDQAEQVILEYRVNKHLSVESQMGRRNPGADVLLNLDF